MKKILFLLMLSIGINAHSYDNENVVSEYSQIINELCKHWDNSYELVNDLHHDIPETIPLDDVLNTLSNGALTKNEKEILEWELENSDTDCKKFME